MKDTTTAWLCFLASTAVGAAGCADSAPGDSAGIGGESWISSPPLPFARSSHALAYDRARDEVVLIGGIGGPGDSASGAVWATAGKDWQKRDELRDDGWGEAAACYDTARERVVVFGGWNRDNEFRGDTWEWDGLNLVRAGRAGPAPRAGHDMAFDPVQSRCILFGG